LGTGKFTVQYERGFGKSYQGTVEVAPPLKDLSTGKLGLEIKPEPPPAAAETNTPQEREKTGFTAWGKEVGGLHAGLGYLPGQRRTYYHGETVKLVLRVRNVGKKKLPSQYLYAFRFEGLPAVTNLDGKPILIASNVRPEGLHEPKVVDLTTPGKEIELYELKLELRPASESAKKVNRTLYGTGKFQIQYEGVSGWCEGPEEIRPTLSKLATGKLELEVKAAEKLPEKREKEGFTAWGQEAGGLQAGLGYLPGQHRAYHTGETVTLVVRVRNVGKKEVKFEYLRQFFIETPPAATDGAGKPVPLGQVTAFGIHLPVKVNLAPGKEIEIYELKLKLTPAYGTGKLQIQYGRVLGNTSSGTITLDPALSKLATGMLELDIKSEPPPAATEKK
jgi:hypothetical protein